MTNPLDNAAAIAAALHVAHSALWTAHEAIGGGPSVTARDLRRVGDLLYAMAATWSVAGDALRDGDIQSVDQVADALIGYGLNGETVITRRALDALGGL